MLANVPCDVPAEAAAFLNVLGLTAPDVKVRETTIKGIVSLLRTASRNDYIEDEDNVLPLFGLDTLECGSRAGFTEELLDGPVGIAQLKRQARALPCRYALTAELERIYAAPKATAFHGHPVTTQSKAETPHVKSGRQGACTVRNIIEQAMMRQASRLLRFGTSADEALSILTAEDIEATEKAPLPKRPIGFDAGIARPCVP